MGLDDSGIDERQQKCTTIEVIISSSRPRFIVIARWNVMMKDRECCGTAAIKIPQRIEEHCFIDI